MLQPHSPDEDDYVGRASRLMALAAAKQCSGVLITSPHAIYYYTGFETTGYYLPHVLLLASGGTHLLVRDFEEGNEHPGATTIHSWGTADGFDGALQSMTRQAFGESARVLFEDTSNFLRPEVLNRLREHSGGIVLVAAGRDIDRLRSIKSRQELQFSRRAGTFAAAGLASGLKALSAGITERQVSLAMLEAMMQQQGEFPASLPYTYFGSRSWRRMQQPDTVVLTAGEPFYIECGGSSSRYAAATLRSGYFGKCPAEYRDLYATALDCFLALERSLKPGVISAELDAVGSEIIGNAGFSELRLSKFGYSLGVAFSPGWGEAGAFDIDPHSQTPVAENMVIHLVSTLMSPKWGTVGLSETLEVTEYGCVSLTPLERGLIELN